MQRNSVILVVLATVVLVSVATFAVVSDDGEQGIFIELREVEPGDAVTLDKTVGDKTTSYRMTVISIDGDKVEMLLTSSSGMKKIVEDTLVGCTEDLTIRGDMYTDLVEEDRGPIYTYMGLRECILYSCESKNPDIDHVCADAENGLVYESMGVKDGEDMHIVYTGISMLNVLSPGPVVDLDDELKPFDQLVPGDFMTVENVAYFGEDAYPSDETDTVAFVDKTAGIVTIYDGSDLIEINEDDYLGAYTFDPSTPGAECKGTEIVETGLGYRECLRYEGIDENDKPWVIMAGAESNIIYYVSGYDWSPFEETVKASSMFVGGTPGDAPVLEDTLKDAKDLVPGDYYTVYAEYYGDDGSIERVDVTYTVAEVDGDDIIYIVSDHRLGDILCRSTAQELLDSLYQDADASMYDAIKTGIEDTEYGDRYCLTYSLGDEVHAIIGADTNIGYYYAVFEDGNVVMTFTLGESSMFVGGTPGEVPEIRNVLKDAKDLEAGDEISYSDSTGDVWTITNYVISEIDASKDYVKYNKLVDYELVESVECTVAEYQALLYRDIDTSLELTQKEEYYLTSMSGFKLCTGYYLGEQLYMMVGDGTNICYEYAEYEDGKLVHTYSLYTTVVVGSDQF